MQHDRLKPDAALAAGDCDGWREEEHQGQHATQQRNASTSIHLSRPSKK
jgi:hypothetical protein